MLPTQPFLTRCVVALCLWLTVSHVAAVEYPAHPPIPLVVEYDVDPTWPQQPSHVKPFGAVSGIAVDQDDNIWIYNRGEDQVQVYKPDGTFVKKWEKTIVEEPHHLRIDPMGNIWLTDIGLHVVHQFTPSGKLLKTLGVSGQSGEDEMRFNAPTDVAVSPEGEVFISDGYGNRRIVHFDKDGEFVKSWGTFGAQPGQFVVPHAIVMDVQGRLYVADRSAGRIQVFGQDGKFIDQWDQVIMPWGLTVTDTGDIWACGSTPYWWKRNGEFPTVKDQVLIRFASDGSVRQIWGVPLGPEGQTKRGQFNGVHCIAQDNNGNLYVGDVFGSRAQKLAVAKDYLSEP